MLKKQPDADTPDSEFIRMVRGALANLYDCAYLQNHSLVYMLDLDTTTDHVTRAQGMRRALLECVEALRPEAQAQDQSDAARAYAILTYRYVDGLSMEEIAGKLALSRRQAYREHRKGIQAVASLLWDRTREARERAQAGPGEQGPISEELVDNRLSVAQTAVDHLQRTAHTESLSFQQVIENASDLLAPLAQQTGVRMSMSSPSTWPPVIADRVMLRQALLNLLSHALHVTRGNLVITASQEKDDLLIDILESPGNSQAQTPSLPKPDEVGLTVAQSLIEAQGGRLETQELEGEWKAHIRLPTSHKATLLVIDDNVDIVALFRRYLAGHAISVIGATDGEQALRQAEELQPKVITLDVLMPSQDGWEILQALRGSPAAKGIPIIICSVLNEPQLALSMGASDYIMKPVSQAELLEALSRWLGPLQPVA